MGIHAVNRWPSGPNVTRLTRKVKAAHSKRARPQWEPAGASESQQGPVRAGRDQ